MSDVLLSLETIFHDNKDTKAIQLDNELRNIVIGKSSINAFVRRATN